MAPIMAATIDQYLEAVGHRIRRAILTHIHQSPGVSYTQLLKSLGISTGKLNFHLKKLQELIVLVEQGYHLTERGTQIYHLTQRIHKEFPPDPDPTQATPHPTLPRASIPHRAIAMVVDVSIIGLLLVASLDPSFFTMTSINGFPIPLFIIETFDNLFFTSLNDQGVLLLRLYVILLTWLYFAIFEGYRGQSIGKILMGIRIVDTAGNKATLHDAAVRALAKTILLPIDIVIGVAKTRKLGYIRYFAYYTRTIVIKV